MIKITNLEQIKEINLKENRVFYIYGKIGSGKTYFAKEMAKMNNKKFFYTDFYEIIYDYTKGRKLQIGNEEIVIIDDEIKTVIEKEFVCLTLQRILENLQKEGKILLIVSSLTPKELEEKNKLFAKFVLQGKQIEICYDIETRMKIAEKHCEKQETIVNKNVLKSISKEENLGKIKGKINQMSII